MRVQHNIAAMNSYRNYNNNTKSINKNLEKLSSGYKINRAGDDAAGLAISEKMRAQITGLEGAQKNAKDGISLVQTAEGALTEVHSMLNRMYSLAEQSANGTFEGLDREQLQKEVNQLRTEINRIADSSNFNGIKLLDGSMSGKSQAVNIAISETKATLGKYQSPALGAVANNLVQDPTSGPTLSKDDIGKTLDYTVKWTDKSGASRTTTVSLTFKGDGDGAVLTDSAANIQKNYFTDATGKKYNLNASGQLTPANLADGFKAGLLMDEEFTNAFNVTGGSTDSNKITFEAKESGSAGAIIEGFSVSSTTSLTDKQIFGNAYSGAGSVGSFVQEPFDSYHSITMATFSSAMIGTSSDKMSDLNTKIFEIDGQKFLVGNDLTKSQQEALDKDVEYININNASVTATESAIIAGAITQKTGMATEVAASADSTRGIAAGDIIFTHDRLKLSGTSLTLQVGDTADSFNQMDVKIGDVHASALGIYDIDISKQGGAQEAMDAIKNAINTVSDIRGTLGATQNRLEHTINNLSVMQENIQDAESTIRDTDVADEMMKYTKNSILVQSAQAMLAQANQQPQGVLQLLQ